MSKQKTKIVIEGKVKQLLEPFKATKLNLQKAIIVDNKGNESLVTQFTNKKISKLKSMVGQLVKVTYTEEIRLFRNGDAVQDKIITNIELI